MKFKVKFNESKVVHTVRADKKEDFVKYITENASKIDTIEKLTESVKVTPELVDRAWKELQRRARKNHYISTQAMEAVCHDFSQYSEWDDDSGTDMMAFDQIWDLLIDRMDAANYELVDADDYNKMFNLPTAPQTSLDVQMNTMRRKNNAMVREAVEDFNSPKQKKGLIKVPVKIVFEGEVYVDGENSEIENSEELAKAFVGNHFYSMLGTCEPEYGTEKIIVEWNIDTHGTTIPEGLED